MEQNTVLISLEKYEEFIDLKYQIKNLKKENERLKNEIAEIKMTLLKINIDKFNIKNYSLEELTDVRNYHFGIENKIELLKVLSLDEMIAFIKAKKEEYEKEEKENE